VRAQDAFAVCAEIYARARETLDQQIRVTRLDGLGQGHELGALSRTSLAEFAADFALAGNRVLPASRLALFRVYYLGGAPYRQARRHLGISERAWADWDDEIRIRVGRELIYRGLYPPRRYFRERSCERGKSRTGVACRAS